MTGARSLDRKVEFESSIERSEKPVDRAFKGDYDIAIERYEDRSLAVKNQEGEKILRLDSKRGTLEIGDMASFGVVADVIAKQKGNDISISLSGAVGKKDKEEWGKICDVYGLSLDPHGHWGGKVPGEKFKELVDKLGSMESVGKEAKSEEHSRLKINLTVLDPSLTETLNEYILSGQFKKEYRYRKFTYDVITPFYKTYKDANVWAFYKADGFYDRGNGIRIHKHEGYLTMVDSKKGIIGFGNIEEARKFQEKLGKIGIVPAGSYPVFNKGDPLAYKFEDEGAISITAAGTTIVPVDPNSSIGDYDDDQRALPKALILYFYPEDFANVAFQYDQYAQQSEIGLSSEFGKK